MKTNLLITLSNIGDVVMTTPVITAVKRLFPGTPLTVVAGPKAVPLLQGSRFIDELAVYDKKAPLREQADFLIRLRRKKYDLVVDLRNTAIPWLVSAQKRSPVFRNFKNVSKRAQHLEVLQKMGFRWKDPEPFDFFHPEEEQSALEKVKRHGLDTDQNWIVAAPVAASELKTWKLEGFKEVLRRLLEERPEPILIAGDARERRIAEPLTQLDPSRVILMAGETTLRELCALVNRASLLVANDSAVMHIGCELHRPVVGIFGPTHPGKYGHEGPRFRIVREPVPCSPCERSTCRFERQACFEDLSAEKIFQACRGLLHEYSHR